MPSLNWVGKEAVVNHDKEVPFKLLKKVKSASVGDNSENLIIHGDNLEGLKALMPHYVGRVKCIYIDPPYNTGNEMWIYNDKVNSPKIKQWLGKVVGGESEDLTRHDKWLCMMYPRLKLLKDLLTDDGILFVSIDEHEIGNLILLLKEIFGNDSLEYLVWRKTGKQTNTKQITRIKTTHENIIIAYKDKKITQLSRVKLKPDWKAQKNNPDNDPRGNWESGIISRHEDKSNPDSENFYTIVLPSGRKLTREFYFDLPTYQRYLADNKIYFPKEGDGVPRLKIFENEEQEYYFDSIITQMGDFTSARDEIKELFGNKEVFNTPKPRKLLKEIVRCSTNKDSIILDSFAGSGTTGHAVLDLNKEDGGNRKFIMVEMEDDVAKGITAERIKRAIKKYDYNDGFEYCELTKPLFDENGQIEETCDFKQFATYIFFTETQTNIDPAIISGNFIGEHQDTEYYLIYKENGTNTLDRAYLKKLRKNDKKKVVYADRCTLGDNTLTRHDVIFKQIPYEVRVY